MRTREYERIKDLLLRHACGESDEEEERELAEWRGSDPRHEELFRRVMSARNLEEGMRRFVKSPEGEERAWRQIEERTIRRTVRRRWLRWTRVAAVVALPLAAGAVAWWLARGDGVAEEPVAMARIEPGRARAELVLPRGERVALGEHTVILDGGMRNVGDTLNYREVEEAAAEEVEATHLLRVPRGGEYTVVLADGTVVYMNAESELRYPARFGQTERRVRLSGEAYFDVARDGGRPFVVETSDVAVRVYGTEFNVTAYGGEPVRTTLVEGKVGLKGKGRGAGEEVALRPGQMAEYDAESGKMSVRDVDTFAYTAWKSGKFAFEEETIEEIMERLLRWYDMEVFYQNEEVKGQVFSGVITRYAEVRDILHLIECTATVHFDVKGNTVIVK